MYYRIDDALLSRLKALAATHDPELAKSVAEVQANPLITSLTWTNADALRASRRLLRPNNTAASQRIWFDADRPLPDPDRERLAEEIVGNPDELCFDIRDDVERDIELAMFSRFRDAVQAALDAAGSDIDVYDILPTEHTIHAMLASLPKNVISTGIDGVATWIVEHESAETVSNTRT